MLNAIRSVNVADVVVEGLGRADCESRERTQLSGELREGDLPRKE